jgi:hypothetical protein
MRGGRRGFASVGIGSLLGLDDGKPPLLFLLRLLFDPYSYPHTP